MTKLVTLKVEEELLRAFDAWCSARGVSRSEAVRSFMAAPYAPTQSVALPESVSASNPDATVVWKCLHPKAKEDKKPYGTWCGVCRKRLR